jgi:SAM-dependent methyltransferase
VALAEAGALRGRVLDVGCGTGEHALLAAGLGLEATGVDSSPRAIERAQSKARERGLPARFLVGDALRLSDLNQEFESVLDCGLFHVFDDADRVRFVDSLAAVMAPGARYHMLCFSDAAPGLWGPRRVSQDEIRAAFAVGWRVDSIEPAGLEVNLAPGRMPAWLTSVTRGETLTAGSPHD